jgi:hypothetical protein
LGKPSRFYLVVKVFVKTLGVMLCPSGNLRKERDLVKMMGMRKWLGYYENFGA